MAGCFSYSILVINDRDVRLLGQNWVYDHTEATIRGLEGRHSPLVTFHKFDCNIKRVSAGGFHFVVLLEDGRVFGAGDHSSNQYGIRDTTGNIMEIPNSHFNGEKIVDIVCGGDSTVFIGAHGSVFSCGINNPHQFSLTHDENQGIGKLFYDKQVKKIFMGEDFTFLIMDNNEVISRSVIN